MMQETAPPPGSQVGAAGRLGAGDPGQDGQRAATPGFRW